MIDIPVQDTSLKDVSIKEASMRDSSLNKIQADSTMKDISVKDASPRDFSVKETSMMDFSFKRTGEMDIDEIEAMTKAKESAYAGGTMKNISLKDTSLKDVSMKETSMRDSSLKRTGEVEIDEIETMTKAKERAYAGGTASNDDYSRFWDSMASIGGAVAPVQAPDPLQGKLAVPGAHAQGGRPELEDFRPTSTNSISMLSGLTAAVAIDESSKSHIPHAVGVTDSSKNRKPVQKTGECGFFPKLVLGLFLALMPMIIAVVVILSNIGADEDRPSAANITKPPAAPVAGPDSTPTSFLPDYTLQTIQNDPDSPQALAFDWLMHANPHVDEYAPWKRRQRYALAVLHYSLHGHGWLQSEGWLDEELEECNWNQTTPLVVDAYGYFPQAQVNQLCNADGHYRQLRLPAANLQGSLPPEIGLLSSGLEEIDLAANLGLTGTIPTELGLLSQLTSLNFLFTGVTGSIPSQIGLLSNLKDLAASSSSVSGLVPTEIGNLKSSITRLNLYDLSRIQIPREVFTLSNLEFFWFGSNQLEAENAVANVTLKEIFENMSELDNFCCAGHALTGSIPTEIGLASKLTSLSLGDRGLSGSMPAALWALTNMVCAGMIRALSTASRAPPLTHLALLVVPEQHLYLHDNQMTGTLPSGLSLLTDMRLLSLESNHLTGTVPAQVLEGLSNLEYLYLHDNPLSGMLPSQVALLSNLYELQLRDTDLTGTIPAELLDLSNLYLLTVHGTSLEGTIPEGVCHVLAQDENLCTTIDMYWGKCRFEWINASSVCDGTSLCGCNCEDCKNNS